MQRGKQIDLDGMRYIVHLVAPVEADLEFARKPPEVNFNAAWLWGGWGRHRLGRPLILQTLRLGPLVVNRLPRPKHAQNSPNGTSGHVPASGRLSV